MFESESHVQKPKGTIVQRSIMLRISMNAIIRSLAVQDSIHRHSESNTFCASRRPMRIGNESRIGNKRLGMVGARVCWACSCTALFYYLSLEMCGLCTHAANAQLAYIG